MAPESVAEKFLTSIYLSKKNISPLNFFPPSSTNNKDPLRTSWMQFKDTE